MQAPSNRWSYLFGPVASRRLGLSLGVDMVPAKVCCFNCVYCEAGLTDRATLERLEYVPTEAVIHELEAFLANRPVLDYITFSGAGEPTLHIGIERIITFIKRHHPDYRLALLTNACLFPDPELRAGLRALDLVSPSLDAADDAVMARINRPVAGIGAASIIEGLAAFRRESGAVMWLEIFIVPGINDGEEHLKRLRDAVLRIGPDRVQLNTLDRPGAEPWVRPAARAELEAIASRFRPLTVEIVARMPRAAADISGAETDIEGRILDLVRRRPCTAADLAAGLGATPAAVARALRSLEKRARLKSEIGDRGRFYSAHACG